MVRYHNDLTMRKQKYTMLYKFDVTSEGIPIEDNLEECSTYTLDTLLSGAKIDISLDTMDWLDRLDVRDK